MSKSLSNEFYIWNLRLSPNSKPIAWHPPEHYPDFQGDDCGEYFSKVFETVQRHLNVDGLVFYFTRDTNQLPSYGDNIVAVVIGDEWSRVPKYAHKVRAIFKCYGISPTFNWNLLHPSYLNFLIFTQFLKAQLANLPGWLIYLFHQFKNRKTPRIYDIPLGYSNQEDLSIKPIDQRNYDVFFAGSVVHRSRRKWSLLKWIETPKSLSRNQMLSEITKIQKHYKKINIELSLSSGFLASYESEKTAERSYSEKMMDTKICLVPRGTSVETFRFFEAMRYGCLIITEQLPSRWFYQGSPAIQLNDWSELEELLERIIDDKHFLYEKHQEGLIWWKKKCSEVAVGNYIAEKLNAT
jgi:hypothetical protein